MACKLTVTSVVFVFLLCKAIVKSDLIKIPKDTETLVGFATYFNCATSIPSTEVHWFHYSVGSEERNLVYGYNQIYAPYKDRYEINKNEASGEYNLVISSLTVQDAGKFECQDDFGRGTRQSAQLIVLENEPVCQSNMRSHGIIGPNNCGIDPETLLLLCNVHYRGNQHPLMEWRKTGTEIAITEGVKWNVSSGSITYTLAMTASSSIDGDTFRCQTTKSTAKQYGCTSAVVEVVGSTTNTNIIIIVLVLLLVCAIALVVGLLFYIRRRPTLKAGKHMPTEDKNKGQQSRDNTTQEIPSDSGTYSKLPSDIRTSEYQSASKSSETYELLPKQGKQSFVPWMPERPIQAKMNQEVANEIELLNAEIGNLELRLFGSPTMKYKKSPAFREIILKKEEKLAIRGIAILDGKLFAVFKESQEVDVYDSVTFNIERTLKVDTLNDPKDIASCKINKFLYIFQISKTPEGSILGIEPASNGATLKQWPTNFLDGRISTYATNVIVCVPEKRQIIEYSSEGKQIRIVRLSPGAGIDYLRQAIQVTRSTFLACYNNQQQSQSKICLIDFSGNVIKTIAASDENFVEKLIPDKIKRLTTATQSCTTPTCLVEDADKSILVGDLTNKCIWLFNSATQFKMDLLADTDGAIPVQICFDEEYARFFVGVNKLDSKTNLWHDGRILIFDTA